VLIVTKPQYGLNKLTIDAVSESQGLTEQASPSTALFKYLTQYPRGGFIVRTLCSLALPSITVVINGFPIKSCVKRPQKRTNKMTANNGTFGGDTRM
jgi:hypothetical protein